MGNEHYTFNYNTRQYTYPDTIDAQVEPFATVVPSRSPSFKVHRSEGVANSALSHHKQGAKYELVDGVWTKRWEFYEPTNCENCNGVLDENRDKTGSYYRNDWLRSPLWRGSHIFAPFLCRTCYEYEDKVVNDREAAKKWRKEEQRRKEWDAKFQQAHDNRKSN